MKKNNMPLNLRERINSRISLLCSVIVLVLLVLVMHQMDYTLIRKPQKEAAEAAALKEQQDKIKAETPVISTASVIAVGDNLYHSKLYESGENDSGIWNYDHIYTHVLDQIQAADVAMIDQETVFAPSHDAVSTYPSFATPQEVGDAIIKAGFDVVESATNHADDYGYDYLKSTLDFWSTNYPDIPVLGIHATQEDADTVKVKEIKVPIHIFKDILYSILLGVSNRPNRRETQPFCQRRLDNEQGRTAGARDEIHAIGMEFWYRLRKHAMIIHIHQPDTVRADQGGSRLIHDIQHLLLQDTALVCLLAETG